MWTVMFCFGKFYINDYIIHPKEVKEFVWKILSIDYFENGVYQPQVGFSTPRELKKAERSFRVCQCAKERTGSSG